MTAHLSSPLQHVFGPVLSGRLGRSLGLDLLGARICTFDCLYCEVGKTDNKTTRRAVYADPDVILAELAAHKDVDASPVDAVSLGGLGEPCLNSAIESVIAGAKKLYPDSPVTVLTNSSLLWMEEVRSGLLSADIVLPSLDSLVESEFFLLNRPCPDITLKKIIDGLVRFRSQFSGRIYLEVLLADGINDSPENLEALLDFRAAFRPDRIDVVTLSRPGAYLRAKAAGASTLEKFRDALGATKSYGVPAGHGPYGQMTHIVQPSLEDAVLGSLRRRPQSAAQLAMALGRPEETLQRILSDLTDQGIVLVRRELGEIFFSLADG